MEPGDEAMTDDDCLSSYVRFIFLVIKCLNSESDSEITCEITWCGYKLTVIYRILKNVQVVSDSVIKDSIFQKHYWFTEYTLKLDTHVVHSVTQFTCTQRDIAIQS